MKKKHSISFNEYKFTGKICPHCGKELHQEIHILKYPYVCLSCDENFFEFEVHGKKK